jgi:hypothetical protein
VGTEAAAIAAALLQLLSRRCCCYGCCCRYETRLLWVLRLLLWVEQS